MENFKFTVVGAGSLACQWLQSNKILQSQYPRKDKTKVALINESKSQ